MTHATGMKRCAGCEGKIKERYLLFAVDKYWHKTCLRCSQCGVNLDEVGRSCFVKGGAIMCRTDYLRLYGESRPCATCGIQIPAAELVLRACKNVYHVTCFTCTACKKLLKTGDKYCVRDRKIFCERDGLVSHKSEKATFKQKQRSSAKPHR